MKNNIIILTISQALAMSAPPMIVLIGGIIGADLASNVSLATLPLTMQVLGVAIFSVPAALLMKKIGRRFGFMAGSLLAVISSIVGIYSITIGSFWLFCFALYFYLPQHH